MLLLPLLLVPQSKQLYVQQMHHLWYLIVLALAVPCPLLAQASVQGRVLAPNGDPVTSAALALRSSAVLRTTTTDSTGRFAFNNVAAGEYTLYVERIGYLAHERAVSVRTTSVFLQVSLDDAPVAIDAVTVEGQRTRARFENQAGVTTRELSKAELKLIPGFAEADVLRAVEALPGVVATSDFSSSYNVRGGSADQNLIMLDGIPIYNPFHLGGMFSVFNSEMVERAELLAGGFPAEYGGRVSSVLNVISDAGTGDFDVRGAVSVLATSLAVGGSVPQSTAQRLGVSSARFRVGARRSYFDQLFKPLFDFPYHLTDLQFAAEVFVTPSSRFTATAYMGEDALNFAGVDSFPLKLDWKWSNAIAGAAWTKTLARGGQLDVRTSFSRFNTKILFPDFGDTRFSSDIKHGLLKAHVTRPGNKRELKFGGELNSLSYSNLAQAGGTVFRRGTEPALQPSAYAQLNLKPSLGWLIEVGFRQDVWLPRDGSRDIYEPAPRLAVKRFFANGDAAAKIAVGRYTQFVHSLRDEEFPIGIDVWVITGARAPHVVSDQVQAGIEWFPAAGWYAALETYYRKFDGVATNNFADDPNDDTDDLLEGKGLSYGGDIVVRKDEGRTRGFLTMSLLKAWREFPDFNSGLDPLPVIRYAPLFDRRMEIDLVLSRRLPRGWEGGLRWNFGSGIPYTRPVGGYRYFDHHLNDGTRETAGQDSGGVAILLEPRNVSRYPSYHRLDVSVRKQFDKGWGTLTPHIDILNVYNRKNVLFYFYDFNSTPATRSGISMFPLLPTVGVEIKF